MTTDVAVENHSKHTGRNEDTKDDKDNVENKDKINTKSDSDVLHHLANTDPV